MLKKPQEKEQQILLVEDEPIIATDLQFELHKLGYENVKIVDSGEEAVESVKSEEYDLILLDIQLAGNIDGIDTAHQISKITDIPFIYLTSNTDDKSFERAKMTQPKAFLSKPYRSLDLKHAITLALEQTDEIESIEDEDEVWYEDRFFIRSKEWLIKIKVEDLLWIEADGCYCKLHTKDKEHTIISTLKKFEQEAPGKKFKRVHRSYMVNLDAIDKLSDHYVSIRNQTIPIGKNYKQALLDTFKRM